jgi:hypothetical protein
LNLDWSAEIPGKVVAKAEALTEPMTPAGKRVQTINAPGGAYLISTQDYPTSTNL